MNGSSFSKYSMGLFELAVVVHACVPWNGKHVYRSFVVRAVYYRKVRISPEKKMTMMMRKRRRKMKMTMMRKTILRMKDRERREDDILALS